MVHAILVQGSLFDIVHITSNPILETMVFQTVEFAIHAVDHKVLRDALAKREIDWKTLKHILPSLNERLFPRGSVRK